MCRKFSLRRNSRITYTLFLLPLFLACISWTYFPSLATLAASHIFRYEVSPQASWLWQVTAGFFYTWYTFLAIGVGGIWALAAAFSAARSKAESRSLYPSVSFVVPAYNEEKNIPNCIKSLYRCAASYEGPCEIIVVDDGSSDYTYEVAWSAVELGRRTDPRVPGKVVRHSANLGKVEAVRTGANRSLGNLVAVVDADSCWSPDTLSRLVDYMLLNGKKAVTGYVHPSDGETELNPYVVLQQLEYSQGLGISRCAQSLGNNVLVVSGAIGLYDADTLRGILNESNIHSVTEDLEITLEMHKEGAEVGYVSLAKSSTIAPLSLRVLWNQRLRWFTGWLHNTCGIHRDMLFKKDWQTLLLWYCHVFEYMGAIVDIAALSVIPILFWFAPDRIFFVLCLFAFIPYGFLIGTVNQAIALKLAYNDHNYRSLLFYTPFYPIMRLINIVARLTSSVRYVLGDHGNWAKPRN